MLKKTLFQAFSYRFCEFLHNGGFWDFMRIILREFSKSFWTTASRCFIIETTFCDRDKNHKFHNLKTTLETLIAAIFVDQD